ncbi:MAG: PIN domain-containing protein [Chloroflexi bacterium]|nr:PIN domain-containing protein [Chloroflexota bacterium]
MIVVGADALIANYDRAAARHGDIARILSHPGPRLVSPLILGIVDRALLRLGGDLAQGIFLDDLALGAFQIVPFGPGDVAEACDTIQRHADLGLTLADASVVVIARHHNCPDVLTLDPRFARVPWRRGRTLRVLPTPLTG